MLSVPIAIRKTGSSLVTGVPSWATPGIIYNSFITALTGLTNSVASVATTGLATGTMLKTIIGNATQEFVLAAGTADVTDSSGQVMPFDFNSSTNQRFWLKEL